MALTLTNSNYGGENLEKIYLELGLGNEIAENNICEIITDEPGKVSLPSMSQTDKPIGPYSVAAPDTETFTTSYKERSMTMAPATIYQTFNPDTFHGTLWKLWSSVGDFTNLELNSKLMSAILDLKMNKVGAHISLLSFQGDKTGLDADKMNYIDGWITRAIADANVIKPTPQGNITADSFVDILAATWQSIPSHLIKDPDFTLKVSTNMWKLFQTGNMDMKKAFTGVLGMGLGDDSFLTSKIIPFDGMPDHYILGSKSDNLYSGFWVSPDNESVRIDRVLPNSREWFIRMDIKLDVNYVAPSEIVLYEPS